MPAQVILVALTLFGFLAMWKNPQSAFVWFVLVPVFLFDRHPWWLRRTRIAPGDMPLLAALFVALLTVVLQAPVPIIVLAYAIAAGFVILRAVRIHREARLPGV